MACACLVRPAESDLNMHLHILRHSGRSDMLISEQRECHGIRRLEQSARESVRAYEGLNSLHACWHMSKSKCCCQLHRFSVCFGTHQGSQQTATGWSTNTKHQMSKALDSNKAFCIKARSAAVLRRYILAHVTVDNIWPRL